jgi:hypothetical protein
VSVFFDAEHSHTATHFHDAPPLRDLAIEILTQRTLTEPVEAMEVDLGRTVGVTDVVEVDATDTLVYAMRVLREDQGWVPFTRTRSPQPCSVVSLHLAKRDSSSYELISAWIGALASPPFPQMLEATPESIPYWHAHAFVWGSQRIIPGSEQSSCPW